MKDQKNQEARESSRPGARWIFRLLVPSLVVVLVAGAEILLRLTGVGMPRGKEPAGCSPIGLPMYECGPSANGVRTCRTSDFYRDYANSEEFTMPKPAGEKRVVCVGGSAVAGMPFYKPGAFPFLLELAAQEADTYGGFRVINAGVEGYTSFEVLEVVREVLRFDPDLLIVYMGNNDFYSTGAGRGVGPWGRAINRIELAAWRTRLYKLISSITLRTGGGGTEHPSGGRDLDSMLRHHQLIKEGMERAGVDDEHRRRVDYWYRRNLEEIIRMAQSSGVEVLLCTVPVNLSGYLPNDPAGFEVKMEGCSGTGDCGSMAEGEGPDAITAFRKGCCAMQSGDMESARAYFQRAVDLDPNPFRASSAINRAIRDAAGGPGVMLADVEAAFSRAAKNGIPGDDLFLEHVHPTLEGHGITALTILEALVSSGFVKGEAGWRDAAEQGISAYFSRMPDDYLFRSYYTSASFCTAMGRLARALRLCRTALEFDPDSKAGQYLCRALSETLESNAPIKADRD